MQNVKSEIRFSLNSSPLSELADGERNVIEGAKLSESGFQYPLLSTFAVQTNPMLLLTGATGLLGSHLLLDLLKSGKTVRALRRDPKRTEMVRRVFSYYVSDPDKWLSKVNWFDGDLLDHGSMQDALEDVTEVYHTAAIVSFYPGDHQKMLKVNIEGTANLVNLSIDKGVARFCYVSSIATLGRDESEGTTTEDTWWVPSGKNSVYSLSKYGAEREVWRGMEEGLNAVIINPSVILGPGYWHENSGLFRLVSEGLRFYTRGMNGYVDVRDVSRAMIALMAGGHFGGRFICSAANVSYLDLFSTMAKYLGKPAPTILVPPALSSIAWRLEAIRAFVTGSKPEITREMATTASRFYEYSSEKLCKALNFQFIPVEETIKNVCKLYAEKPRVEIPEA
jgi:nucleoside-diphosphate-sugar epimerase